MKRLVEFTGHSEGPASQGEEAPPHLLLLMNTYKNLQPIQSDLHDGGKKKNASVQNREVAHDLVGLQTSLVGKEDGIRHSTQSANKQAGKETVERGTDKNNAVIELSSDSESSPSSTKKSGKKRPGNMKDGRDAQKVISDHTEKSEQTANALKAITSKLLREPSSNESQLKQDQLKLNQDYLTQETEFKKAKIELDEKKYLSEKKIREELVELKKVESRLISIVRR